MQQFIGFDSKAAKLFIPWPNGLFQQGPRIGAEKRRNIINQVSTIEIIHVVILSELVAIPEILNRVLPPPQHFVKPRHGVPFCLRRPIAQEVTDSIPLGWLKTLLKHILVVSNSSIEIL